MEIKHLSRKNINQERWDLCVRKFGLGMPYAFYEYLDIATGGQWEALVSADYQYLFPLPFEKKMGLKFYAQPLLCQQLGLIGSKPSERLLSTFLSQIPTDYNGISLKCNEANMVLSTLFETKKRTNYVLDLDQDFDSLSNNFSKSLRKRIRQSADKFELRIITNVNEVVAFYKAEMEKKLGLGTKKYDIISKLLVWLQNEKMGNIYAAKNVGGAIEAMLFVAESEQRIINLFGASNDDGRTNHAMHFILNELIQKFSGRALIFDFEGSDIPGVSSFYQSFGSVNRPYLELTAEQLPTWYKVMVGVKRMIG